MISDYVLVGEVQIRILVGVGAWLLGATTATAGSLLAVSLLGQGIADSPGQQLTSTAVNRALAHETDEATATSPAPTPSATRPPVTRAHATSAPAVKPQRTAVSPSGRTSASRTATASPPVTFESDANSVTMTVTCLAGTPVVTSYVHGGGDD